MEDDLDNLIAESIGGVQSALESERKAASTSSVSAAIGNAGTSQEWAKEAVRELKEAPVPGDGQVPGEDFFAQIAKTFQDESFQKAMADALKGVDPEGVDLATSAPVSGKSAAAPTALPAAHAGPAASLAPAPASAASSSSAAAASDGNAEEFLSKFMQSFDKAVGGDESFEKSLGTLMPAMLSHELICEPLEQISSKLEPWLKSKTGLSQSERSRYETQLRMYKHILQVYRSSPDPLPDDAREEVQRVLTELHSLGQLPDDIMQQLAPKDAAPGDQSFEDFMKSMGLDNSLGSAEQDLLKKLSEDPEELTKVMKDMAEGLPEEACKQQ
mmetsp:Transcript_63774/g.183359  ORF Transcript_63774/g.183359 Transcript_63774/m.183359 type:complete len:329 (-) Transcript_63774:137-1123(-)